MSTGVEQTVDEGSQFYHCWKGKLQISKEQGHDTGMNHVVLNHQYEILLKSMEIKMGRYRNNCRHV